ncbi:MULTISPECIES: GNAT family N-acetyltransferase [unclassified Clostridium]|uniref:GNAT family N-acetyltransferase n=1 Tax=unclassified Clostridium TaxID=2614128 RepID=UPI0025C23F4A|nr:MULTISPECIES: GNAT family N-acetyltransferase [unclassified Clostridium]
MEFKIREVEMEDRERVNDLATKLLQLHKEHLPNIFTKEEIKYNEEEFKNIVENSNYYMVVAESEEKEIVGFSYMEIEEKEENSKLSKSRVACMSMIQVEEDYMGLGVGTELMKTVEAAAKEKKNKGEVDRIELRIWSFNSDSEKFSKNRDLKSLYTVYEVL